MRSGQITVTVNAHCEQDAAREAARWAKGKEGSIPMGEIGEALRERTVDAMNRMAMKPRWASQETPGSWEVIVARIDSGEGSFGRVAAVSANKMTQATLDPDVWQDGEEIREIVAEMAALRENGDLDKGIAKADSSRGAGNGRRL